MSEELPEDWKPKNGLTTHSPIRNKSELSNKGTYIIILVVMACYVISNIIVALIIGGAK
jgi:MFS superfamily sulfate permease-like transporter